MSNRYRRVRWKRNLRRVPDSLRVKLDNLPNGEVSVARVQKIEASDIADGRFEHLGITLENGVPQFLNDVLPLVEMGKYSEWNREGRVIVHRDQPKVIRTFCVEVPNWGDWSNGSHEACHDRQVYRRSIEGPKGLPIHIELLNTEQKEEPVFTFLFRVDHVLDRADAGFDSELLYALNILQENTGGIDIFPSTVSREDYLNTLSVPWEILPIGTRPFEVEFPEIVSRLRPRDDVERLKLEQRYRMFRSLNPSQIIVGSSGFARYLGAKLSDDLVVFENLTYGNALYIFRDNWKERSQASRVELLSGSYDDFDRIIHTAGWEQRLQKIVRDRRPEEPPQAA